MNSPKNRPNFIKHVDELISSWTHAHSHDEEFVFILEGHPDDKIFYPLHEKRNEECKKEGWFWEDHPKLGLGPHDGKPT